jgi:hypothetical protein
MTTTCSHRHLHEHTQAPTDRWLERLTKVSGPARSAPSPSVTVRRWHRQGKRLTASMTRPQGPSGSIARAAGRYPCSRHLGSIFC